MTCWIYWYGDFGSWTTVSKQNDSSKQAHLEYDLHSLKEHHIWKAKDSSIVIWTNQKLARQFELHITMPSFESRVT